MSLSGRLLWAKESLLDSKSEIYRARLIQQALDLKIYEKHYWQTLLHYRKGVRGSKSEIDDPSFFLSASGKKNPKSELIATIKGFFKELEGPSAEHPRCRFIARYHWLQAELEIDSKRLPQVTCGDYEKVIKEFGPRKAILAFPAAYMNNPASMFGHTLLNIQGKEASNLLSQSINYSARTPVQNGIIFAFKGIFGFYKGYYEVFPYYARTQLYNDINQRDIWEYKLNLNPLEVQRLIMHMWELKDVYSKYYFFDENCSYNLLYLLQAARPSLSLIEKFRGYVIPLDTIRAVIASGLVETVSYRPSKASKMHSLMDQLGKNNQKLALSVGTQQQEPDVLLDMEIDNVHKGNILDLATEFLQIRYFDKEMPQKTYQKAFLNFLRIRSQIPGTSSTNEEHLPTPELPESGHRTRRLRLGVQFDDSRFYTTFGIRPAYHDLIDPEAGYVPGSEIEFFDLELRYDPADEIVEISNLNLLSIIAVSSRDLFFKPVSWNVQTGISSLWLRDKERHHLFFVNAGQGLTWNLCSKAIAYGMAEFELLAARTLDPSYSLGIGGTSGILARITPWWKLHLYGTGFAYEVGDIHSTITLNLEQRIKLFRNAALEFKLSRTRTFNLYKTNFSTGLNLYF